MIIRNLASNQKFIAHTARRPKAEAALMLALNHFLYSFDLFTGRKVDTPKRKTIK